MVKGIISAVIGDMSGSTREFRPMGSMRFKMFDSKSTFTDDSVLTMAVAEWMMNRDGLELEQELLKWGRKYPNAGYGRGFKNFLKTGEKAPVGNTHNGSAMRVSSVGYLSNTMDQCLSLARESALPSHNSPQGISGAQAAAAAIFMARTGSSKAEIRNFIEEKFGFDLSLSYDEARGRQQKRLAMRESRDEVKHAIAHEELLACDLTVTDALIVFLSSESYEETIKRAIYLGGDSDTLACIAGAVAGAFWGVPEEICEYAVSQLPPEMIELLNKVDGTAWKPSGVTPLNTKHWSKSDYVVYGTDRDGLEGEAGFVDVKPGRFNRHPNSGYPIMTIGSSLDGVAEEVAAMLEVAAANPSNRYLVRELGTQKAGFSVAEIAPLFHPALAMDNVLLPQSFADYLAADSIA